MLGRVDEYLAGNRLLLRRFRAGNNIAAEPLVKHAQTSSSQLEPR